MRCFNSTSTWTSTLWFFLGCITLFPVLAVAENGYIGALSLKPCMENSGLTATWVDIALHPNTSQVHFDIRATSTVSGYIKMKLSVVAYGFTIFRYNFNPCDYEGWVTLCPINPAELVLSSNEDLSADVLKQIPTVAYSVPDLDAYVKIEVLSAEDSTQLACVEAPLSNGVTTENGAVSWVTAFVSGGALLWAIFVISSSSSNVHYYHLATAKFATYALTMFTFLQNQALIGMTSVPLPPIVSAWTQNFMWTVGILEADFLQHFFHWYIRSTGGTRTELFNQLTTTSILVMKRDFNPVNFMQPRGELKSRDLLQKRATSEKTDYEHLMVKGIERVAYKARIEQSNLFLTSYGIFIIFVAAVVFFFMVFKTTVDYLAKKKKFGMEHKLLEFRQTWREILKKICISMIVFGFPAMIAISLWEMTMKDSPAAVALAVVIFLVMTGILGYAVFNLYMVLRRNAVMPFSSRGPLGRFSVAGASQEKRASGPWADSEPGLSQAKVSASQELKAFAIFTIPYRRSGAYWVLPLFLFVFTKSALVGLVQQHVYNAPGSDSSSVGKSKGLAQAVGFLVMDLLWLIGVAWVRPWMDKRTNTLGISVASVGSVNAILLFLFTANVKSQAKPVASIAGLIFTVLNVIVSLTLLIILFVGAYYALVDWKKGHVGPTSVPGHITPSATPPPISDTHNMGTPDPFLDSRNDDNSTPNVFRSSGLGHAYESDSRADSTAPSLESRDMVGMQPMEPRMSNVSFHGGSGGNGMISSQQPVPHYPLLPTVSHNSTPQTPLGLRGSGIVGIGGGVLRMEGVGIRIVSAASRVRGMGRDR
ncbi:hypothetical protein DFH27DRAFT_183231 [Peziza echinospora]|nr:hypothetical protein DFH27DRAFT_183231 [Peziza echinospora]